MLLGCDLGTVLLGCDLGTVLLGCGLGHCVIGMWARALCYWDEV